MEQLKNFGMLKKNILIFNYLFRIKNPIELCCSCTLELLVVFVELVKFQLKHELQYF